MSLVLTVGILTAAAGPGLLAVRGVRGNLGVLGVLGEELVFLVLGWGEGLLTTSLASKFLLTWSKRSPSSGSVVFLLLLLFVFFVGEFGLFCAAFCWVVTVLGLLRCCFLWITIRLRREVWKAQLSHLYSPRPGDPTRGAFSCLLILTSWSDWPWKRGWLTFVVGLVSFAGRPGRRGEPTPLTGDLTFTSFTRGSTNILLYLT